MKNVKRYVLYIHTNKQNQKSYIGITGQIPERRWKNGFGYKNNPYFWKAIQKYGWDGFEHIIFADNLNEDEAKHMEILLIALYKTTNPQSGYNISIGGEGSAGVIRSNITKKKLSDSHKGKMRGDKNPFYGKNHTEETKQLLSQKAKERFKNPENNPMFGKPMTEEKKEQLRKINMEIIGCKRYQSVPCYSPELNESFDCSKDVYRKYGINDAHIRLCYQGKRKHAGKHPQTGELLSWLRLEDAILYGYINNDRNTN